MLTDAAAYTGAVANVAGEVGEDLLSTVLPPVVAEAPVVLARALTTAGDFVAAGGALFRVATTGVATVTTVENAVIANGNKIFNAFEAAVDIAPETPLPPVPPSAFRRRGTSLFQAGTNVANDLFQAGSNIASNLFQGGTNALTALNNALTNSASIVLQTTGNTGGTPAATLMEHRRQPRHPGGRDARRRRPHPDHRAGDGHATFTDPANPTLKYAVTTQPTQGSVNINPGTGAFDYTPTNIADDTDAARLNAGTNEPLLLRHRHQHTQGTLLDI